MRRPSFVIVLALVTSSLGLPVAAPSVAASPVLPHKSLPPPVTAMQPPTGATGTDDSAGGAPDNSIAPTGTVTAALDQSLRRVNGSARTKVEILTSTPTADAQLRAVGATSLGSIGGVTLASLTTAQVRAVAGAHGVTQIRPPLEFSRGLLSTPMPQSGSTTTENSAFHWNAPGDGTGVKVGILDLFDPSVLATQIANGDVNAVPASQRFCFWQGQACAFGTPGYTHGNSVAEVLSEGAPGATLFLAEVDTLTDYARAIDWFAANGVTIINHSATGAYDAPGDGTGPSAAVIDYAVSKGMAWFNAAGNAARNTATVKYSGGYFRGKWSDPNNNRWMNWYGTDESLSVYCGALMGVRWSDWALPRTDYDLYISDYSYRGGTNGKKVLASANNQAAGAAPLEGNDMRWLCNTDPAYGPVYDTNKDGFVSLWLYRTTRSTASPVGDIIEVMVNGGYVEWPSTPGTADIPFGDTKNPGAASIGALSFNGYTVADYSGRGPTNDGRLKPDFVELGCLTTSLDGSSSGCTNSPSSGFQGTSAATPVAAAVAAVGESAIPLVTPAYLMAWMRTISRSVVQKPVPSNDEGYGWPQLPEYAPAYGQLSGYNPITPTRILDTRGVNGTPLGAPIGVRLPGSITTVHVDKQPGTTVMLNVTMVHALNTGYLQAYPTQWAAPGATSSVNVVAGQTRANFVVAQLGQASDVSFYTSAGGQIVVDLVGEFASTQLDPGVSRLVPLRPFETFESGTSITGGSWVDVPLAGAHSATDSSDAVPPVDQTNAQPTAVAISVTVSGAVAGGFLSVTKPNVTTPGVSNLNYQPGETLSGTTFLPVDAATGGAARIFVSTDAQVRVDILGYFTRSPGGAAGWFKSTPPTRLLDTRLTSKPADDSTVSNPLAGRSGLPYQGIGAVFVNATSVQSTAPGWITAGTTAAAGEFRTTSIPAAGWPIAAGSLADVDFDQTLRLHTSVSTQLIADIGGWFTAPDRPLADGITPVLEQSVRSKVTLLDISDDGSRVLYETQEQFPSPPDPKFYVFDRTAMSSTLLDIAGVTSARLSGDGSTVVVVSTNDLLPVDTNGVSDVYAYRIADGTLDLVSVGNSDDAIRLDSTSNDGTRVVFGTTTALTGADTDTYSDEYLRDRIAGSTTLVSATIAPYSSSLGAIINGPGTKITVRGSINGVQSAHFDEYDVATHVETDFITQYVSPNSTFDDVSDDGLTLSLLASGGRGIYQIVGGQFVEKDIPIADAGSDYTFDSNVGRFVFIGNYVGSIGGNQSSIIEHQSVLLVDPVTGLHRASATWNGALSNGNPTHALISDDGMWVAYITSATNTTSTASGVAPNIYLVDLSKV